MPGEEFENPRIQECCGEVRACGALFGILGFLNSRILGFWLRQWELAAGALEGDFGQFGDFPAILGDGDGFGIGVAEIDANG
jgi:hypothetical protein